jgi:hypothetical protein
MPTPMKAAGLSANKRLPSWRRMDNSSRMFNSVNATKDRQLGMWPPV